MDGGPHAWPLPHSDPDGTFYIPINANNIETAFYHASTPRDRLLHKRFFSLAIHHLRDHHPPTDDNEKRLYNLSSVLERASAIPHCPPIPIDRGRSLPEIVDEVVADPSFFFGPASQKPGEAEDDCRFICIFCHKVRTRTGDLKFHLRRNHSFENWEIDQTISKDAVYRLRVFGPYSYEDVILNNWDIPEWKPRGFRGSQATAEEEHPTSSQKRKTRHRIPGSSPQPYADLPQEGSPSMKRRQSPAADNHATNASQAMLYDESSTVSMSWCIDAVQLDLPKSSFDDLSLASYVTSDEALLAQVGSSSEQQDVDAPPPRDNTHTIYLSSDAPLIHRLARPHATGSTEHPRRPPRYMQRGGQRRH